MAVNWVSFSEMVSITVRMLSPATALTLWIMSGSLYCTGPCHQVTIVWRDNKDTCVEDGVCSVTFEELVVTRRSDCNDLVPRELCELNRVQTDARAPSVDEKPSFVLEGGGMVERLNQFEISGSVQGLECCVESSGRAIGVRDEIC